MEWIIPLAALVVLVLVAGWLLRLVRNTIQTVLLVLFLLLALYFIFGIGPTALWEQIYLRFRDLQNR
ncbi:MAG: hypothetical protein VKL98_01070 [Cyanobacteriota bacterium]|nr:hypothetical protein [Cyanobacteriota bacterium]